LQSHSTCNPFFSNNCEVEVLVKGSIRVNNVSSAYEGSLRLLMKSENNGLKVKVSIGILYNSTQILYKGNNSSVEL
jgi:hypothetical protein